MLAGLKTLDIQNNPFEYRPIWRRPGWPL